MSGTYMSPVGGYIADCGYLEDPGILSGDDRKYLRELARQVRDIASLPIQEERRLLWLRHNALEDTRPLVTVYPEDGWQDLIPRESLRVTSPMWRQCEWYLRHLIYRHDHIRDDFVIQPVIFSFVDWGVENGAFGLEVHTRRIKEAGAWVNIPSLTSYDDLPKLKPQRFFVRDEPTRRRYEATEEVFGDILQVEYNLTSHFMANQPGTAAALRGIEQLMFDMADEPENVHALMRFLTDSQRQVFLDMEASGWLTPNSRGHYVDSGGNGYSRKLPIDEKPVTLKNLWGFGVAQEFSGISPDMHEEFGVRYQKELLALFGLSSYGCCEPYTYKFDMLRAIPNLRRISISPWCDIERAAAALGPSYILSWKPNPAVLIFDNDPDYVRSYVRDALKNCRGCRAEVFLKDIIHLRGLEQRLWAVCDILQEEIHRQSMQI